MVKNQTILNPAGSNLGKGDSRYISGFCVLFTQQFYYTLYTSNIQQFSGYICEVNILCKGKWCVLLITT